MKNNFLINICVLSIMIFCCVIVMFCCAAVVHDLKVMKQINFRLQEEMGQLAVEQAEQSKEMRVMKTNNDIVFDLVINKEWEK